jgi:hypothetical protein
VTQKEALLCGAAQPADGIPGGRGYLSPWQFHLPPAKAGCLRRVKVPTVSAPPRTPEGAPRVIVCDYNALLQSITGLLRMSGFAVFQAYDGEAAEQLCEFMPQVDLLVLNTEGTGVDLPSLVRAVRKVHPGLPVLHVGRERPPGMPADVANLPETFGADELLTTVRNLVRPDQGREATH